MKWLRIIILLLLAAGANADLGSIDDAKAFYSADSKFCVITVPAGQSLYLTWNPLGDTKEFEHPVDVNRHDSALAVLYHLDNDSVYRPAWEATVPYVGGPSEVEILGHGKYVVMSEPTIGNPWVADKLDEGKKFFGSDWRDPGTMTDNSLVILDSLGRLVSTYGLHDLFPPSKLAAVVDSSWSGEWLGWMRLVGDSDELEVFVISNPKVDASDLRLDGDRIRLRLSTGEILSYTSDFEAAQSKYDTPCYDSNICPAVRYLYYSFAHPDPAVVKRVGELELEGGTLDSLRQLYDEYVVSAPEFGFGMALGSIGRRAYLAIADNWDDAVFLVEAPDDVHWLEPDDRFPMIVRMPDSTLTFTLLAYCMDFDPAILNGACYLANKDPYVAYPDPERLKRFVAEGKAPKVYLADSAVPMGSNMQVKYRNGTPHIFIDLVEPQAGKK